MWPAVLGMTYVIFRLSRRPARRRAHPRAWPASATRSARCSAACSPTLLSWRLVFFINLPVTLFRCWVETARGARGVASEPPPHRLRGGRPPVSGALALLLALDLGTEPGLRRPGRHRPIRGGCRRSFRSASSSAGWGERLCPPAPCGARVFAACVHGHAVHVRDLLLRAAVPAAVHGEGTRASPPLGSGAGLLPLMASSGSPPSSPARATAGAAPGPRGHAGAAGLAVGIGVLLSWLAAGQAVARSCRG